MENLLVVLGVVGVLILLMRRGRMGCCGAGHSQTSSESEKGDEKKKQSCH